MRSTYLLLAAAALLLTTASCVMTTKYAVETDRGKTTRHLAKVHLRDGSVAIFPGGFALVGQDLAGVHAHYDFTRHLTDSPDARPVPLDSVLGVVTYPRRLQRSILAASLGLLGAGSVVAAVFAYDMSHTSCGLSAPALLPGVATGRLPERASSRTGQRTERTRSGSGAGEER